MVLGSHRAVNALVFFVAVAGCSNQASSLGGMPDAGQAGARSVWSATGTPWSRRVAPMAITHIVLVIQENRSFNNLFMSYPGATTVTTGLRSDGKKVKLKPVGFEQKADLAHNFASFLHACNGTGSIPGTNCTMNGFDLEAPGIPLAPYVYVPQSETAPYWSMAQQYVLDDMMFPSQIDDSFTAHQYLIAAESGSSVNTPTSTWGCDGNPGDVISTLSQQRVIDGTVPPCFDYQTLGDELDNAGLTWHFYVAPGGNEDSKGGATQGGGFWSAYRAVNHIRNGPDWAKDVITPPAQFLSDVAGGTLSNVTWVVPTFPDSDHPGSHSAMGPSWVASVVNAVGESQFWDSTAIVVVWDDWGGLYDSVPPKFLDYDGLGIRVGSICISPFAYTGKVDHTQYEFGSIDRFVEDTFGLGQLAQSDARATSVGPGCIDPSLGSPRSFVPIQASPGRSYFLHEKPDGRPPDTDF